MLLPAPGHTSKAAPATAFSSAPNEREGEKVGARERERERERETQHKTDRGWPCKRADRHDGFPGLDLAPEPVPFPLAKAAFLHAEQHGRHAVDRVPEQDERQTLRPRGSGSHFDSSPLTAGPLLGTRGRPLPTPEPEPWASAAVYTGQRVAVVVRWRVKRVLQCL